MLLSLKEERQSIDKNGNVVRSYLTSFNNILLLIDMQYFIACQDLIEVKQGFIILQEPIDANYSLRKSNLNGQEYLILLPKLINKFQPKIAALEDGSNLKLEGLGKIFTINKEDSQFSLRNVESGNFESLSVFTQMLNKEGFSKFWSINERYRLKVTIFPEPKDCEEESKDDFVDINGFFSKKANEPSRTAKAQPKNEIDKKNSNTLNNKSFSDLKVTSAKIDLKTTATTDQKIAFINGLINLSNKRNVNDKTRERLFGLIGKELGKTGTVEEEILREVRGIREGLILHSSMVTTE